MHIARACAAAIRRVLPVALVVAVLSPAAGAVAGLTSSWRTADIAVDGLPLEWQNILPLDGGPSVGASNDDEFLYLVVSARDPQQLALLETGLIVWLDPTGRRAQTFGLWMAGLEPAPLPGMNAAVDSASATGISTEVLDRFDLLGPGKSQRRLVDVTPGLSVEIAAGSADGALIYELKLPLRKTATRIYAVDAEPGGTIGLGIATPVLPRNSSQRSRLVGSGGFIGGNPFYGGGFADYREREERSEPLEIWTTLTLASPSS